ncbi:hypothetical protein [Rickettsiales endosymbiont of Stachyamoeba lipophora]|uniref:hypothetical protein n=1 Tax=Rickettsiales endosymbiont of Stachyamoeba lipophora TaxID=2486578 RepID=UPI000F655940|nr:hypothetical protein [Rickettsiales endosymbiont of Stachyamoeba lipophora]AZL16032.1 hypothetical protein EF513_05720 [Rickettsiales endosymbiont of Stachyamoeba lipophora]
MQYILAANTNGLNYQQADELFSKILKLDINKNIIEQQSKTTTDNASITSTNNQNINFNFTLYLDEDNKLFNENSAELIQKFLLDKLDDGSFTCLSGNLNIFHNNCTDIAEKLQIIDNEDVIM